METFSFEIANGQRIAGRHFLSRMDRSTSKTIPRPLIVCIHGASYDSEYFDPNADYSWSALANAFDIPIVSIDRPGYGGCTELPDQNVVGDASSATPTQRQARYINSSVMPRIWDEFGLKSGASSVVIMGHSVGGMVAIQAAGSYATQKTTTYPLSGLIVSGVGCVWRQGPEEPQSDKQAVNNDDEEKAQESAQSTSKSGYITFETAKKDFLMLNYAADKSAAELLINADVLQLTEKLNHPAPLGEIIDIAQLWQSYWRREAEKINVPLFYALSEVDPWFESSDASVSAFAGGFTSSPKVIHSRVLKAPHCMELSLQAKGWMLQCGGFALECAVTLELSNRK
uniref:2-succinyl-6-hydroxy-2, 4-cyclohexadiene-1-carboxylate synthase n=1 Tax=Talaromyces marneffei PM1 TaxID=1077442 RepID=A0A093V9W6_TALMA